MGFSQRLPLLFQPRRQRPELRLLALLCAVHALRCVQPTCEETETCSAPYDASADGQVRADSNVGPTPSQDASADVVSQPAVDATDVNAVDADREGPADAGEAAASDAEFDGESDGPADATPTCSDTGLCGCVDLLSDPRHCGTCWHQCPSGVCNDGACEAIPVASGSFVPRHIAVDSDYVYWVNKGESPSGDTIMRLRKAPNVDSRDAGLPDRIDPGDATSDGPQDAEDPGLVPLATGLGSVVELTVSSGYIYWAEDVRSVGLTAIWRIPRTGGVKTQLELSDCDCSTLLIDDKIYWAGEAGICSMKPPASAAEASIDWPIDRPVTPTGLAIGPSGLYWTESSDKADNTLIHMMRREGGTPEIVARSPGCAATTVALGSDSVYWGCQRVDQSGTILRAPLRASDGGAGTVVASTGSPWGMTIDGSRVYWCDALSGEIRWAFLIATSSNPETNTVGHFEDKESCKEGFAIDATSIYWTNARTGTVMRAFKP